MTLFFFQVVYSQIVIAQVTVGNCYQSDPNIPTSISQNFSCSQQIFLNSRINRSGVITSIQLWRSTLTPATISRNIEIYMGMTSKNQFDSTSDWVPASELRLVFSGIVNFPANNWVEIPLDNAFLYDNSYNLLLAVDDNSQQPTFSVFNDEIRFRGCVQSDFVSLFYENSIYNPDFINPPAGVRSVFTDNIVLFFEDFESMSNDNLQTCDAFYTDPQGVENYAHNLSVTQTIYSTSSVLNELTMDFIEFDLASGDTLIIYDGGSVNAPILGFYVDNRAPVSLRASGSSLTLRFVTNATDSASGWLAHIYCQVCNPVSIMEGSPCAPSLNGNEYSANPFCTDNNPLGITFPSATGDSISAQSFFNRPNVACLVTLLRPAWYYMQINDPGDMLIYIQQMTNNGYSLDVDFACWGPFSANNRTDFLNRLCCGEYSLYQGVANSYSHRPLNGVHTSDMGGYPIDNLIDCSADVAATEWCFIPNAQAGEFYILLITNFDGDAGTISFNANNVYTEATTDCTLLNQVNNNSPLCEGDTLILFCETQLPNADYLWIGPHNQGYLGPTVVIPNVTSAMAGEYTLVMTVNGHNADPISTSVIVNQYPTIQMSGDTTICFGDSVLISASGATTYFWNHGLGEGNSHTVSNYITTNYNVIAYSEGCAVADSLTVTVAPLPETTIQSPDFLLCPNIGSVAVSTVTTSGMPEYAYSWAGDGVVNVDNAATQVIINSDVCDSVYDIVLTVTDNLGCRTTDSAALFVGDTISPILSAAIPNRVASYVGGNYQIPDLTNLIHPLLSDNCWANNQMTITQDPNIGTIITENTLVTTTIVDPCGNLLTTTSYVNVPLSYNTSQTNVSCFGGNDGIATCIVQGGMQPYRYLWSTPEGDTTQTVSNLSAGLYTITVTDNFIPSATVTIWVNIYEPQILAANAVITDETCENDNGSIILQTTGGYLPYSFVWNNGGDVFYTQNLASGSYYCTITDGVGCVLQDTFLVQSFPLPTISLLITHDTLCPSVNAEILNTAVNDTGIVFSYVWNGPNVQNQNSASTVVNIHNGFCDTTLTIIVTLTDTNTCVASDTGTIYVSDFDPPTYTASVAPHASIVLGADHIIPNLTNLITTTSDNCWNMPQITITQTPAASSVLSQSDSATIYITDGCNNLSMLPLYLIAPNPIAIADMVPQNITCSGANDGSLQVSVSGGTPPFAYQWNGTTQNEATVTQLAPGSYSVTVTDYYALTATASEIISEPQPLQYSLTTNEWSYCETSNGSIAAQISGGTAPYSYSWNNGATENNIENLSAGVYSLTIIDDHNCMLTVSDTIYTTLLPVIQLVEVNPEMCHEANGSITVQTENGTPDFTYLWSLPDLPNSPFVEHLEAGDYAVTVTDMHGCADTLQFSIESFDIQSEMTTVTPDICGKNNGTATVLTTGGNGNYLFNWFDIQYFTDNFAFNIPAGNYMMTVAELICIDTLYFAIEEIVAPEACFTLFPENNLTVETVLQFSNCSANEINWHWNFGNGEFSNVENPSYNYPNGGTYTVVLTVSNDYDCLDSVSQTIDIHDDTYIYLPTAFSPNGDGLNELFKPVYYNISPENYSMVIYNRWGQEVFYTQNIDEGWDGTVNGKLFLMNSTFVYVVHYCDLYGKPFQIKGSVSLTF